MIKPTLYIVPMIHNKKETLGIVPLIKKAGEQHGWPEGVVQVGIQFVENLWSSYIPKFWHEIETKISEAGLFEETAKVKVYSDGFPVGFSEKRMVKIISPKRLDSPLIDLILKLKDRGAKIRGTESLRLLNRRSKLASNLATKKANRSKLKMTIKESDKFIANKILSDLKGGEKGVLFIGASHNVQSFLKSGKKGLTVSVIKPITPIPNLETGLREALTKAGFSDFL